MPESNLTRPATLDPRVELWVFGVEHAQLTDVTRGDNEHGDYASIGLTLGNGIELTLAATTPEALAHFATTLARPPPTPAATTAPPPDRDLMTT